MLGREVQYGLAVQLYGLLGSVFHNARSCDFDECKGTEKFWMVQMMSDVNVN